MRLYSFVNHHLTTLQQGIHTAFCVAAMANTVARLQGESMKPYRVFFEWANGRKEIDLCEGGNERSLGEALTELREYSEKLELPIAESHADGNPESILTAVAILVPEWAYNSVYKIDKLGTSSRWVWNDVQRKPSLISFASGTPEFEFIGLLNRAVRV